MPLVNVHVLRGRPESELRTLLDAIQDAQVAAFEVPTTDRYQLLIQHDPHEVVVLDTGLGFDRSRNVVVIHVVSRQRTRDAKAEFYTLAVKNLHERLGIDPGDVIITIAENGDEDWSFGGGHAQFLTGELT